MKQAQTETRVYFLTNKLMSPAESPRELSARGTTQFIPGMASKRQTAEGNVDYKRVVELKGVDLAQYRGKAREEVRVSVAA